MFLYLSKILPAILAPFSLVVLLLIVALIARKWRTFAIAAGLLLLLVPSLPAVSNFLLGTLERQYPDRRIETLPEADAILVLGGTIVGPGGPHRTSHLIDPSDRLLVAYRLYRAGKAPLIVSSGGTLPILGQTAERPEAEVMCSLLEEWGVPASAVLPESGSANTRENATRSYDLLSPLGIRRILLVTSALHMPRAAATFRRAGFEVTAAPADFRTGWRGNALDWLPNPKSLIDSESALHEWIGLWTYRLRGWEAGP